MSALTYLIIVANPVLSARWGNLSFVITLGPSKDVKYFLLDQTLSWLALAVDFPQSGYILLIAFNLILCPTTLVRIDLATTNPKQNFKPLSFCLKWLKLPSSSLLKVKNWNPPIYISWFTFWVLFSLKNQVELFSFFYWLWSLRQRRIQEYQKGYTRPVKMVILKLIPFWFSEVESCGTRHKVIFALAIIPGTFEIWCNSFFGANLDMKNETNLFTGTITRVGPFEFPMRSENR